MICAESQPIIQQENDQIKPLLALLVESRRRVYTLAMLQVFVNSYASLLAELQKLETEILSEWSSQPLIRPPRRLPSEQEKSEKLGNILVRAQAYCEGLSFVSATRQLARIRKRFSEPPQLVPHAEVSVMIAELKTRIEEDLQDRVFFCITDPIRIQRFFKRSTDDGSVGFLVLKEVDEVFDPKVLDRFP